jgi:hypothetical protein
MSTRELIDHELSDLPEPLQREVYDFVRFLRQRQDSLPADFPLAASAASAANVLPPEDFSDWETR